MIPWFNVWDGLKNKTCRYLLQRYLGQFLEEKINLEQLDVELYNGKATVKDVALNCQALNELCETQGWGIEVTGGRIGLITVTVPWSAIMTTDSSIEISDLFISLRPVPRPTDGSPMLESMWSSMSSSMQLAQDYLENHPTQDVFDPQSCSIEGLEKFAQTIDSVLTRIKAKCINTEIRLEYLPPNSSHGTAIIIKVGSLNYRNETANENVPEEKHTQVPGSASKETTDRKDSTETNPSTLVYALHNISVEGVKFYTSEFKISNPPVPIRRHSFDVHIEQRHSPDFDRDDPFYSMISTTDQMTYMENLERTQGDRATARSRSSSVSLNSCESRTPTGQSGDECSDPEDEIQELPKEIFHSKSVAVAYLSGKQEIGIKVKQTDETSGPKISLDVKLGALYIFATPRQIHLVLNFCDAFLLDNETRDILTAGRAEPLHGQSTGFVGRHNLSSNMTGILADQSNWGEPFDEASFRNAPSSTRHSLSSYHYDDIRSTIGSGYCESISSTMSSSNTTTTCSSRFVRKPTNLDTNAEISNFSINIGAATIVILHEDILLATCTPHLPSSPLSEESEVKLSEISEYFFSCIDETAGLVEFTCNKNYIKICGSSILAEGVQQRNKTVIELKYTISITRLDVFEVLENSSTTLLVFDRDESTSVDLRKRPELIVQMRSTRSLVHASRRRKIPIIPKTEFEFNLDKCTVEFDISLYDRMSALFCSTPFSPTDDTPPTEEIKKNESRHLDPIKEFKVISSIAQIRLRFPIADSRPIHDPDRVPYWKQNIRPDFLLLSFYQFQMKFSSHMVEIVANEIDAHYVEENPETPKIHLLKTNLVNNNLAALNELNVEYPRITIEFPHKKTLDTIIKCCTEDSDSGETSGETCELYSRRNREYVPFSSKRVCRQSDTPHPSPNSEQSETMLLPGDKHEMQTFCETAMKTSKLQIKISLPTVAAQVNSKHLYEIIYNRLNTDLLMWEPSSPIFSGRAKPPPAPTIEQSLLNIGMMDSLYVPSISPVHPYDIEEDEELYHHGNSSSEDVGPDSGESDYDSENGSIYYSAYDTKKRSKRNTLPPILRTSACSFELTIGKGIVSVNPSVRDSESRVLPNQFGELTASIESLSIFSVNGFNGDANMAYLCLHSKDARIFHCGLIPSRDTKLRLPNLSSALPSYMQSTFYPTPKDLTLGTGQHCCKREMMSLAIEIKKTPSARIKRLKITMGIQKATLRYNPSISQHTWLNQMIDFLDVVDYPIEGYKPYTIVTEMQLHLWDCAIDYRPKNFPFRCVVEIGSFSTSSNIASSMPGCTLRFVAEETILSLAPYDPKTKTPDNKITVLPSSNLVPVVDLGLLDISLRLNEKACSQSPKFDLRTSIQDVHIRSCHDSGRALSQLIAYIASEGDLEGEVEDDDDVMVSSVNSSVYSDTSLFSMQDLKENIPQITPRQQERVCSMVAEAVAETVTSRSIKEEPESKFERGVEVFFFPDESQTLSEKDGTSVGTTERSHSPREEQEKDSKKATAPQSPSLSRTNSCSDEWMYQARRGSGSSNELQDLLNFETSVMKNSYITVKDDEVVEALPQVREVLGDVTQVERDEMQKSYSGLEDDFCVIAEEEKSYLSQCGIKDFTISEDPLRMVDNHFKLPTGKQDLLQAPESFPMPEYRYTLCEMTITWHIYGGHDFPTVDSSPSTSKKGDAKNKDNIRPEQQPSMSDAFKHGVSYSKETQSIEYVKKPKEKLSWKTVGGVARDHEVLVEIQMTKVRCSHEVYPKHTNQSSRQVLVISELEVRDRLQSSDINKFLYHPSAKHLPNKSSKHMVVIKALHVRPHPRTSISEECSLRISLLPLRLNIDQDTLLFIAQFFNELSAPEREKDSAAGSKRSSSNQPPVMMVEDIPEAVQDLKARQMVTTNLELLMEDEEHPQGATAEEHTIPSIPHESSSSPIYFREVIFSPEVSIRLDYHGRRIEMSRGPIVGFLMGLGQLQCSEIKLKKIVYKHGLLGVDKLVAHLCKEWLADIKKNQVPSILSGVGPTYAFVQLFQGVCDLFRLPFEQYQKDGRLVRGLQLGAQSFTARTALAALEITSRLIQILQITAETAYDMVSPGPSIRNIRRNRKNKRKRLHRPQDIREGVFNALQIVKEGLNDTANTLIETAVAEHDQKGYTGAVGGIIRQIPQLVVQPAVLATQATTNILGGVKSSLVPDAKMEAREKWKEDSD